MKEVVDFHAGSTGFGREFGEHGQCMVRSYSDIRDSQLIAYCRRMSRSDVCTESK